MKKESNESYTIIQQQLKNIILGIPDRIWVSQWVIFIEKDPESQINFREYGDLDELTEAPCSKLGIEFTIIVKYKISKTWLKYCKRPAIFTDEFLQQSGLSLEQLFNLTVDELAAPYNYRVLVRRADA